MDLTGTLEDLFNLPDKGYPRKHFQISHTNNGVIADISKDRRGSDVTKHMQLKALELFPIRTLF